MPITSNPSSSTSKQGLLSRVEQMMAEEVAEVKTRLRERVGRSEAMIGRARERSEKSKIIIHESKATLHICREIQADRDRQPKIILPLRAISTAETW